MRTMHEDFMLRALEISAQALPECLPNPPVGCVLVKDNTIVSEGFTQAVGGNHAEIEALNGYSNDLVGVTAYVTLEPCSFVGRTPSCAKALVERGLENIVVGIIDTDCRNNGKGIQILVEAGVNVEIGVCSKNIQGFLLQYLCRS